VIGGLVIFRSYGLNGALSQPGLLAVGVGIMVAHDPLPSVPVVPINHGVTVVVRHQADKHERGL